jgi:hypothetical protein
MAITDYNYLIDKPYLPGQVVTLDDAHIWSYVNGVNGILPFGLGVVKGANPSGVAIGLPSKIGATGTVVLPSTITDKFEGISYYTNTLELRDGYTRDVATGRVGYPIKQVVSIVRRGVVAVFIDSAVNRGDPVHLRAIATPGATGIVGCFRNGADGSNSFLIPDASFIMPAPAPAAGSMGIGYLELRSVS